jgi:hypothetical protein
VVTNVSVDHTSSIFRVLPFYLLTRLHGATTQKIKISMLTATETWSLIQNKFIQNHTIRSLETTRSVMVSYTFCNWIITVCKYLWLESCEGHSRNIVTAMASADVIQCMDNYVHLLVNLWAVFWVSTLPCCLLILMMLLLILHLKRVLGFVTILVGHHRGDDSY